MPSESRQIVFLSDFGLGNEWVGICHAVMTDIAPHSPIVDVSHLIRALHVVSGALLLADCMPDTSRDAVALAVVDLNVGKDREIAIETESGRALVGPDNSLLVPAAEAAGGVKSVFEIASPEIIRQPIAPRFAHATRCARPPPTLRSALQSTGWGRRSTRRRSPHWTSRSRRRRLAASAARSSTTTASATSNSTFGRVTSRPHTSTESRPSNVAAVSASTEARRGSTCADFGVDQYGVILTRADG